MEQPQASRTALNPSTPPGAVAGPEIERAAVGLVLLGMALRLTRYLTCQPIWGDEAFLAASWIDRGYLDLLRPLEYHQVAPLLFLWVQKAAADVLGYATWSLRLFPLLCGMASVALFAALARQTLSGWPRLLALAIFAVAFYPIRHATEIKPYATDLAVALALLNLAVAWTRAPDRLRWPALLCLTAPLAIGLSHPAVFVAGAIVPAMLPAAIRMRSARVAGALVLYSMAVALAFVAVFLVVTAGQSAGAGAGTHAYWAAAFPPGKPLALLVWLVEVHTSHMMAYPIGEARGGSVATTLLCLLGIRQLLRDRRRDLLILLLAPLGLGLIAAIVGRYPYGGSARTMQYAAPGICLLAGLGAGWLLTRGAPAARAARRPRLALGLLVLLGLACAGRDLALPYKFPEDRRARDFARAFWAASARGGELVCLKRDLGVVLDPDHWDRGRSAVYLCHQAIYGPRARTRQEPDWARISPAWPLRCVLYNQDPDSPGLARWLAHMQRRFELRRCQRLVAVSERIVGGIKYEDRYDVYEFVPRSPRAVVELADATRQRPGRRD
jgi:hypothetical protein